MNRFLSMLLITLSCLVLTACGGTNEQHRELYSGAEGLILSFPSQNNFQQFEKDTFSIALRLENDGASSVTDLSPGIVSATYDPALFKLLSTRTSTTEILATQGIYAPFSVPGRSEFVDVGGVEYVDFSFESFPLGNRTMARTPITFTACYPYVTTFIKNACVDRDFYAEKSTPICRAATMTDSAQGAPLAITKIEPRFSREGDNVKPRFYLTLTNLQDGYPIYSSGKTSFELCTQQDFDKLSYGRVLVDASLGGSKLFCGTPDNINVARFDGRTAQILCTLDDTSSGNKPITAGANYEAALVIQLHYFYISSLVANVEVSR